jgi:hypothetical protein
MTLGDAETSLAEGVFDPLKDEVRLNDGTIKHNYYRDVMGVKYFKPIDKSRFPLPPSGWCSWYYYYQEVNETEIKRNATWIADNLKDYGARYVQIDDGWQGTGHGLGENRDWTTIDKRFSGGMDKLASYIKSLGLSPGLWLAPHGQSNAAIVKNYPGVFLLKPDGSSAASSWEGTYLVDPSTQETQTYLKDLFTTLSKWGFEYFKIDGQPTVIRDYRNKKSLMKNPADNTDEQYRETLASIRTAIGPDRYLLGCWVVPLEGIGFMNGSRTSADVVQGWEGFKTALRATTQYYFLHNVAWYSDPDVMLLRAPLTLDQARAWATLQGLTGEALMSSDRLMDLSSERVDILRRVYPAVDIRPLDLFSHERNKRIWDLKIKHLDRNYDVVGLFNYDENQSKPVHLNWQDLGLSESNRVHVFDFWNQEYLGAWEKGLTIDLGPTSCRVLTLLPASDQIQLVSTNRHITQGWVDLVAQSYDSASMSYVGKSKVVKNDPYELRFAFPRAKNFVVKSATARSDTGVLPVRIANHDGWATVQILPNQTGDVSWQVKFDPSDLYHFPVREPSNIWAEREGIDGVNLRWSPYQQPAISYQVSINGQVAGYAPNSVFSIRGLDTNSTYTAEVRTAWHDGTISERKGQISFSLKDILPGEMPLSELEPVRLTPGWRQPEMNRTFSGKGLMLGGKHYEIGVGMPSSSEVEFDLARVWETFSAVVGIDDGNTRPVGVEFVVLGDGKVLWRRDWLKKADGAVPIEVSVSGVRRLTLRVKGTTTESCDWAAAKLSRRIGAK